MSNHLETRLEKTYQCSPICNGHIDVYDEMVDGVHQRHIYVCSKDEEKCPLLELQMKFDNFRNWVSKVSSAAGSVVGINQVTMGPQEFEDYKKR